MSTNRRLKLGDRVFRPRRIQHFRLRRVLGIPALFSAGYGNVGSSIYYALGIVAIVALGATPIALLAAGIIYIFNALSYAEGAAMIPEAGGSAGFARRGFNDLGGFIGGWALMLSYITTIAVSAYTIPPYLSFFWATMQDPFVGTATSMGIIAFLMLLNMLGVKESSGLNIVFIFLDIATQLTLVVIGFLLILLVDVDVLLQNMFGAGNWPSMGNFVFGIAIAALAFTGVETVAQMAQEARRPAEQIPRAYMMMIVVVLILFAGISVVALSAMTPQELGDPVNGWARDPVAGIAAKLPFEFLRDFFAPVVAILASSILLTATNAGIIGVSRLAYHLSLHRQLPAAFGRIHHRFRTPYFAIFAFCLASLALMIPGFTVTTFFADLGALYAFGSLLSFAIAHAAIISLRIKEPHTPRPFKLHGNISIGGRDIPLIAALGLLSTIAVWIVLAAGDPFTRVVGTVWMGLGLLLYSIYRRSRGLHLTRPAAPASLPPVVHPRE